MFSLEALLLLEKESLSVLEQRFRQNTRRQEGVSDDLMWRAASVQDVLKDDTATQVTCSFFGDGTCNNGTCWCFV